MKEKKLAFTYAYCKKCDLMRVHSITNKGKKRCLKCQEKNDEYTQKSQNR